MLGKILLVAAGAVSGAIIESRTHLAEKAGNAISALFKKDEPLPEQPAEAKKK